MKRLLYTFVFVFALLGLKAQDIHFSQFYNSPMTLNPALTGLFNEDLRLTAIYRSQWSSITVPYETYSMSADMNILQGFGSEDFIGVGFYFLNDVAGDAGFSNLQYQGSFSYSKHLGGDNGNFLTLGFQAGGVQTGFDFTKLYFDNQFNGNDFDLAQTPMENLATTNKNYLDISSGIAWSLTPNKNTSFYLGFAVFHLNQPNIGFYADHEELLYRKFTFHGGSEFPLYPGFNFSPQFVYLKQGTFDETNIGATIKIDLGELLRLDYDMQAGIGVQSRIGDANIYFLRFDYQQVSLVASFDNNTSYLRRASQGFGGPEVSLSYKVSFFQKELRQKKSKVNCPSF